MARGCCCTSRNTTSLRHSNAGGIGARGDGTVGGAYHRNVLIAEDLLLLLTDDVTGRPQADSVKLPHALAGAVLLELAMAGKVDVAGDSARVKAGRLVVTDASPTGDEILDEALATIREREGKKPQAVLSKLHKGLRDKLYERLAERGILRGERDKVLGLFPRTSWPAGDVLHEQQVRAAISATLGGDGREIEARIGALISLLSAIDAVTKVVDPHAFGIEKRELKRRAKSIAEQNWASEAVRKAVAAVNTTTTMAIVAGSTAAATTS